MRLRIFMAERNSSCKFECSQNGNLTISLTGIPRAIFDTITGKLMSAPPWKDKTNIYRWLYKLNMPFTEAVKYFSSKSIERLTESTVWGRLLMKMFLNIFKNYLDVKSKTSLLVRFHSERKMELKKIKANPHCAVSTTFPPIEVGYPEPQGTQSYDWEYLPSHNCYSIQPSQNITLL